MSYKFKIIFYRRFVNYIAMFTIHTISMIYFQLLNVSMITVYPFNNSFAIFSRVVFQSISKTVNVFLSDMCSAHFL